MLCLTHNIIQENNDDEDGYSCCSSDCITEQQDLIQLYLPYSVKEYADALLPVGLIGELLSPRAGKPRF
jgi:hypothetical protein